jgi:hypothetical protein
MSIFADDLDIQFNEIQRQQIDLLTQASYQKYNTPTTILQFEKAYTILTITKAIQTVKKQFNQNTDCDLNTRNIFDILTTYNKFVQFVNNTLGWGILIDVNGFVQACTKINTCHQWINEYSDESYKSCKDIILLYYNQAFLLHNGMLSIRYGMLWEWLFSDAESKNAPYDLLLQHQRNGSVLDSALHPATNSALYPKDGIEKNKSYEQYEQVDVEIEWSPTTNIPDDQIGQTIWMYIPHTINPKIINIASYTNKNILLSATNIQSFAESNNSTIPQQSIDPSIQYDLNAIIQNTTPSEPLATTWKNIIPICEVWTTETIPNNVDLLSWFAHLVNIRQKIINASIEAEYALEQTGLWWTINQILQDDYTKNTNDTTLYESVYGDLPNINQATWHQQLFGQNLSDRPSFDSVQKETQIADIAQQHLTKTTKDLWWWWNEYEIEAAECKKQFSSNFQLCNTAWDFKNKRSCVESILLKLKKCVNNALCSNWFSVWDYLWVTICRVSPWMDKTTTKSEVTSLQEVANSIKSPLTFLKNSGKILPHKMKREYFETTLKFKLSNLISFQIWHNSKLERDAWDHKKKKQEQEAKNKEQLKKINQSIVQNTFTDKDKYSNSYIAGQAISQTPASTFLGTQYSEQIQKDIASKINFKSYYDIIADSKLKYRSDILKIYDNHWTKTESLWTTIANDINQQAHIAKAWAEAR